MQKREVLAFSANSQIFEKSRDFSDFSWGIRYGLALVGL
jgi:hypothetical protein